MVAKNMLRTYYLKKVFSKCQKPSTNRNTSFTPANQNPTFTHIIVVITNCILHLDKYESNVKNLTHISIDSGKYYSTIP